MEAVMVRTAATAALEEMRARFDHAQVTVSAASQDELNINDNEPCLLRSTRSERLGLLGIVEGRKASTQVTDLRPEAVRAAVDALRATANSAPRDDANQVSSGQRADIVQGPQAADVDLLTTKAAELLAFLGEVPRIRMRTGIAAHNLVRSCTLTTGGSTLESSIGHHSLLAFGAAREGTRVSSLQYAAGDCHGLERNATEYFGIAETLRDLERQIDTRKFGEKFTGDVVLTPLALADLIGWLLGQLCDEQLIGGTSLYKDAVGEAVASPRLSLRSRFDAPGIAAISADGFTAAPVEILKQGFLATLTPSLYGSLKTGKPHVPTAAGGWEVGAGDTSRDKLIAGTPRGALVGRFSMGRPASNGDFAGIIKNSFAIEGGKLGHALAETMIAGNVARMLKDVVAVSRERLDTGAFVLPWVRISGLHFS